MESITSAAEEVLVDSLSFNLPGSGQYVQERRSVTFHTEGSNSYSPQGGTRVIRFKLTAEGWLDPSTVRFFFDVRNDNPGTNELPKYLRPLGAPHAFLNRVIIKMRGVIIEDIQDSTEFMRCLASFKHHTPEPTSERRDSVETLISNT